MKHKKLIAMVMSVFMLAGNCPVLAAGSQHTTKINAVCDLPEIKVTIPVTGGLFINPYQMPVEIDGTTIGNQIVSTPAAIQNESVVPIKITATVTGTVNEGSDMALSSTSVDTSSTRKKAFIYFEIKSTNNPDSVAWDSEFDADKHIVVRTTTKIKKNIVTLDAYDENGKKKCYGAFRLTGNCAAEPKIPWTDADGVNVSIAFTFTATSKME